MTDIIHVKTVTLAWKEVEELFSKVNDGTRYHVNSISMEMVSAIAEQYFREKGHTFWDMPEIINISYKEGVDYTFEYEPIN